MTEKTTGQEVDIAQIEAKIAQLVEEKRAAHEAVASCEYLNMDIHERMKSGCEMVVIESFMSDKHQKMMDDSLEILKRYDEHVVSLALASKDHYSIESKTLLAQKAIMNDEGRRVILSKIKDMYNVFREIRVEASKRR